MSEDKTTETDQPEPARGDEYEQPAIIALGKLTEVTFGAPGPPFEGATSYF
ncbi:MAG TPA: hypothetical protein VF549_06340 [Solirubrobacteraceae bacterium]|jgi:hypothetical protein